MLLSIKKNARFTLLAIIMILVKGSGSANCPYCTECGEYEHVPWCYKCAKGYYWTKGQCYECDKNCNNCSSSNCFQPCESNFGECSFGCKTGYYTYSETETGRIFCRRCKEANCRDCDSDRCTICGDGYFLQHNICESCKVSHCKTCQSLNNCKTCNKGYYGQQCHSSCSKGCDDNGTFPDLCDRATGDCMMGCKPNWRGRLCDVADGNWGAWSDYSRCALTCGNGTRTRTRSCDNPQPSGDGNSCDGDSEQTIECFERKCPVNDKWSVWQDWSICSVTCNMGTQTRVRICDNPASHNGENSCPGNSSEIKDCQQTECPDMSTEGGQETSNIIVIIGAAAGGAVLVIVLVIVAVVLIKRRKSGKNRNVVDNENANLQNADNVAQNREMEPEENAYALPNKFKTKRKNEENPIELQRVEIEASATDEPPPLPTKTNLYLDESDLEELGPNTIESDNDTGGVPEDYDTYYNTSTFMRWRMTKDALMMKLSDNNIDTFKNEFERLANGLTRDYKESLKPENRPRNRYKLVYPCPYNQIRMHFI